jgi:4'-phosphopantetheinyl transferase
MRCLNPADFLRARHPVALEPGEIQLWLRTCGAGGGGERPGDWLRRLLAAYLGCAPGAVPLARAEHGKPYLAAGCGLEFNLSHSRQVVLVGLSRAQPLGVDVEAGLRRRPVLELARRFFSPPEAQALADLEGPLQQSAFLHLWSCKEAVVKALGRGLGFGLARMTFGLDARGDPTGLNVIDASAGAAAEWQIVRLAPEPAYSGALAWRGPPCPVRAFRTPES